MDTIKTYTAHEVKTFCDRFMAAYPEYDLVDALKWLRELTGVRTQHLLWLYTGKVTTVTR
jgi:hypothetical protein